MNQISVLKEELGQEFPLDHPVPSLQSFLELLIPADQVLEYREYVGGQRDCFDCHLWLSTLKRGCFLINPKAIRAAGFLEFNRSENEWSWVKRSETLVFELWLLWGEHTSLETVKGSNFGSGWMMQYGSRTLNLGWEVNTESQQQTSRQSFTLCGSGFDSVNTLYCLEILERAKTAMDKIRQ